MVLQMAKQIGLLRFVLIFPFLEIDGQFHSKDLPGSGRRIDVLCRSLAACFDWGPTTWPKMGIQVTAILADQIAVIVDTPVEEIPRGEVSWANIIKQSLKGNPPIYVEVKEMTLVDYLDALIDAPNSKVWVLEETGTDIDEGPEMDSSFDNTILVGDHKGFDDRTKEIIADRSIYPLSLGKTSYLGSHCVAAIIRLFERKVL